MLDIIEDKVLVENQQVYYKLFKPSKALKGAETIVLLHDSLGCTALWRDLPKELALELECNVLVYDRIGYGQSQGLQSSVRTKAYLQNEAVFLKHLLEQLTIDKVSLVGYSDGGSIALLFGALFQENCESLVCIAGHIYVEEITLEGIEKMKQYFYNSTLSERLEKYHGDKVETLFKAWVDTWTSPGYRDWSIEHLMQDIVCPVLFMQGDKDEYGSLEQLTRTLDKVKGISQSKILKGASHAVFKEEPELAKENIVSFLQKYKH
ncbi:alpha/beta fold hydrolase [Myroides sp. LJL116]